MSTTGPAIYPVLSLRDRAQAVVGYIASGPLADALADLLCQDEITPDRLAEVLIDVHDEIASAQPKPVSPEDKCSCAKPNGVHREWCSSHNYQLCACGQLVFRYDVGLHSMCAEHYGELTEVPAVSEDQPKPRVFPQGSFEPEGVEAVTDEDGFRWIRVGRATRIQHYWRRAGLGVMGNLALWTRLNRRPLTETVA